MVSNVGIAVAQIFERVRKKPVHKQGPGSDVEVSVVKARKTPLHYVISNLEQLLRSAKEKEFRSKCLSDPR